MNVKHKVFVLGAALLLIVNLMASAGPVMRDEPVDLTQWKNDVPIGAGDATLTKALNLLTKSFVAISVPEPQQDTVYTDYTTDPSKVQVGDFTGLSLKFTFNALDTLPLRSSVYLHSTGLSDPNDYWVYAFNPAVSAQDVSFVGSGGWLWGGVSTEPVFATSVATADWIGVNLARSSSDVERYQLSDWGYYESTAVPEPGVVCVLMSALLSMALIFRKRLRFARI